MLLMIEARIRGGMCRLGHRYAKANNKYMKNYDKSIVSSYLIYTDGQCLKSYLYMVLNGKMIYQDLMKTL